MKKYLFSNSNITLGILGTVIFLVVWEIISRSIIKNSLILSAPSEVFFSLVQLLETGLIFPHLLVSLEELLLGITLAIVLGVLIGLVLGWYKKLHNLVSPIITSIYAMPIIVIFPLILIWVGLGIWAKITLVFLAAFFPILINTIDGVKNIDPDFIRLGRSFSGSDIKILRAVIFPATLPFIVSGLRLATIRGLSGMLVAEFFVSSQGLGYMITYFGNTFQTSNLLAVVLIVIFIGLTLTTLVNFAEKRLQGWKVQKN